MFYKPNGQELYVTLGTDLIVWSPCSTRDNKRSPLLPISDHITSLFRSANKLHHWTLGTLDIENQGTGTPAHQDTGHQDTRISWDTIHRTLGHNSVTKVGVNTAQVTLPS